MYDDFLIAQTQLVIFLKIYKIVRVKLSLRDEFMRRKEVCTKLISWLPNVVKELQN